MWDKYPHINPLSYNYSTKNKSNKKGLDMNSEQKIQLLMEQNKYLAEELSSLINSFNQHAVLSEKIRIEFLSFKEKVSRKIELSEEDFPEIDEFYASISTKEKLMDTWENSNDIFVKNWNSIIDEVGRDDL